MNTTTGKKTSKKQDYKDYNAFVRQLQILDIRLISVRIDNLGYTDFPSTNQINWRTKAWYDNRENEIDVFHRYNLTVKDTEIGKAIARLSVVFCATYSSDIPMSDAFFDTFEDINLPLHTWPYFREFTHNSFTRMGWPTLVAPTYIP